MLADALSHYKNWSTYTPEKDGIVVAHASIHGNTAAAAETLAEMLRAKGAEVTTIDLTRTDVSYALAEVMDHAKTVLCASSYDAGLFPPMENLLLHLKSKNFNGRRVGLVENGSWAPCAGKVMRKLLDEMKDIEVAEPLVTIKTRLNANSKAALQSLADAIAK